MLRRTLLAAAPAIVASRAAPAQTQKPLRMIVGFAPGGGTDAVVRVVGQEITRATGRQVIIENRPGAGGNIATREIVRAAPDGDTIMLNSAGPLAINHHAMKDVGFDAQADMTPITMAVEFPNAVVVHPGVKAGTLAEYLALGRRPEGITFGSSGQGSAGHLAGELLRVMSGVNLVHVAYRGGGPAMNDLVAGHVPSLFASAPTATEMIKSGRIRGLATTGAKRSPFLPDVPTVAEQGFAGYDAANWYAFVGPRGMDPAVVARLAATLTAALTAGDVRAALERQGMEVATTTPAALAARIARENETWGRVVRAAGIRIE
ncbi:MAG: tripartite tricarboxylate transporter substrate binding protein [Rhodospirillales bacterium]|nr:MAG: tripartite tricarboxylate transporter substrate binding protein [Rhodospirillales bacterium]